MSAPGGWVCGVFLPILFVAPKGSFRVEEGMQRGKQMHEGFITGGSGDNPCEVRDGGNWLRRIDSTGILLPEQFLQGTFSGGCDCVPLSGESFMLYQEWGLESWHEKLSTIHICSPVRHCILQGKWNYCDYFISLCPSCFHFWYLLIFCGSS